jgi:hypothetical protein
MKKMNHTHAMVWVAALSLLGGILLVTGCGPSTKRLRLVHLPDKPQLVGGGMLIEWKAPQRGTVYLVEKRTTKIIETRSLEKGEVYSFSATSIVQADEFEQMLGIRFGNAQFDLYFEPLEAKLAAVECPEPSESGDKWGQR